MELRVLSDDGDVLRLEAVGRIVEGESIPGSDPMSPLLGTDGHARSVLLSLERTQFIDSSGLSWLVVCHKRFCQGGGKLVLHSVPPATLDLLKMMRLDLVLNLADDEPAALSTIRGGSP